MARSGVVPVAMLTDAEVKASRKSLASLKDQMVQRGTPQNQVDAVAWCLRALDREIERRA